MTTTTHSTGSAPASPALYGLRVLLVASVVFGGLLVAFAALAVVAANPIAVLLLGLPLTFAAGFGVLFGVGRLGAAVAERV